MLEIFTIADASRRVGCCVRTLHEWDRTGRFVARRNSIGHRFYTARDIAKLKRLRSTITVGRPWKAEARGDADAR